MHSEGVYKGLYPAFGARKRRLGLCVFASVLCVNLILFSFSILSFAFFLTSIQLVCSRLRFCFFCFVVFFRGKSFAGWLGGWAAAAAAGVQRKHQGAKGCWFSDWEGGRLFIFLLEVLFFLFFFDSVSIRSS